MILSDVICWFNY